MRSQKTWEELTFRDHFLFERVIQNAALCQRFLSCVHHREIGQLAFTPQTEKIIDARYDAKSVRLDVFAQEVNGAVHDIELQNSVVKPLDLGLRARYYRSTVDQDLLNKGEDYRKLPEVCLIFVCGFDPFGKGLRRYTCATACADDPTVEIPDRAVEIFLNIHGTFGEESADMLSLFHYMGTGRVQGSFATEIDAEVQRVKADEKQKEIYMTLAMYIHDEREQGFADGKASERRNIASRLLQLDMPLEQIATVTGLTVDELRQLQQQKE